MTILGKIIAHKKEEVANRKKLYPINLLEQSTYFETP
ncbi:MAG: indole-3-glycerol phosphate synthase, partial [Saprospiraceae bacterium]